MTTERITDAELAELRLLHEAATPGPWEIDRDEMAGETVVGVPTGKKGARWSSYRKVAVCDLDEADDGEFVSPNADFIAAACNDLHRLLDEIERLHALFEVVGNALVQSGIAESESLPAKAAEFLEEARKALGAYGPKDGKFSALAKKIRGQTWNSEFIHDRDCEIERLRELVCEVANSGVVWQAGAKYLEVQIGSETWKELQAELEKKP